jgi:hypothetical protein
MDMQRRKMTNPNIKIVNVETGEEIERPMTNAEIKAEQANKDADLAKRAELEAEKLASKQAILDRIGLSADELKMLLG